MLQYVNHYILLGKEFYEKRINRKIFSIRIPTENCQNLRPNLKSSKSFNFHQFSKYKIWKFFFLISERWNNVDTSILLIHERHCPQLSHTSMGYARLISIEINYEKREEYNLQRTSA